VITGHNSLQTACL